MRRFKFTPICQWPEWLFLWRRYNWSSFDVVGFRIEADWYYGRNQYEIKAFLLGIGFIFETWWEGSTDLILMKRRKLVDKGEC